MTLYFTDNPLIYKEISQNPIKKIFLTYQIYNWSIEHKYGAKEAFYTKNKIKKKIFREEVKKYSTIEAYIDPANYRFIHDLLYFSEKHNKKLRLFTWLDYYNSNLKEKNNLNNQHNNIVNKSLMLPP